MRGGGRVLPLVVAGLALLGAAGAALWLHRAGTRAVDAALTARMAGAGEAAARLLAGTPAPAPAQLRALMEANGLEGAYFVTPARAMAADATGLARARVNPLRTDPERLQRALAGEAGLDAGLHLGELVVMAGYFPVRAADGSVAGVLVLEAGHAFARPRTGLTRALAGALGLALAGAVALGLVAARWARAEQARTREAERAARGEALARLSAMAAHEIRNPLGVIRGTVELMRERGRATLGARDAEALEDVLGEVERLRRLTEDLLDLSADRPLTRTRVDLGPLLSDAARAAEAAFPGLRVTLALPPVLPAVDGDGARLRQVFANLLQNAAQAQGVGEVRVLADVRAGALRVRVQDDGPGVPEAVRARLFEAFATGRAQGTGLGLALSRRLVERHGGTITLVPETRRGATFEVRLPVAPPDAG